MTRSSDASRESIAVWDEYARFYVLEEGTVYPPDTEEMDFYRLLRGERCEGGRCLELGAGAGRLARCLLDESGETFAIEPSTAMLELWGRDEALLAVRVRGVAEELPFASGSFRMVLFPYNGLQCIVEPERRLRVIEEAVRVLEPDGCLVLEICPRFATRPLETAAHRYTYMDDDVNVTLIESISRDVSKGLTTYDMLYRVENEEDRRVVLDVAIVEPEDLLRDVVGAGLTVEGTWGGYDRRPYVHGFSPRFLLLAACGGPALER